MRPKVASPVHSSHSCSVAQRLVTMQLPRPDVVEHDRADKEHERGDPDQEEQVAESVSRQTVKSGSMNPLFSRAVQDDATSSLVPG